jgi:Putative prokaryotic signal transducing protein
METDLVIVYRSADMNAEEDAIAVRNLLIKNGLNAQTFDDRSPGVVEGTWEVRVPAAEAAQAEALVGQVEEDEFYRVDPSHALDMVTIAEVQGTTGEMEAMAIQSILDANGISAVLVGSSTLPILSFTVQVPKADVERAQAALEEAKAAGPAAAAEGALESEKTG